MKKRTEASHLDFARNEIEPRLQLGARKRAVGRSELLCGYLIGDVLNDRRAFCKDRAIVEFKGRYEAKGIDNPVVPALVHEFCMLIDFDFFEGESRLVQYDVREE